MATVNVYLTFDGQCEEAFEHYRSIFGGDFASLARFGEMPQDEDFSIDESLKNRVMHVTLPVSEETALMGSDSMPGAGPDLVVGTNFSVSIAPDSREQADRFFAALSEGGAATMPMADQFWGAYFGMCTDRFGVNWMINQASAQG